MGTCLKYQKRSEIGDYAVEVQIDISYIRATSVETET